MELRQSLKGMYKRSQVQGLEKRGHFRACVHEEEIFQPSEAKSQVSPRLWEFSHVGDFKEFLVISIVLCHSQLLWDTSHFILIKFYAGGVGFHNSPFVCANSLGFILYLKLKKQQTSLSSVLRVYVNTYSTD